MNLKKLFEMQKQLDDRIVKEHGLEGQDLLPQKILALQVELGECANEWRGFKFWSNNQEPRTEYIEPCYECGGEDIGMECFRCDGEGFEYKKNPLLEEYIDCLHFILSIGNDLNLQDQDFGFEVIESTVKQFNLLFDKVGDFSIYRTTGNYTRIVEVAIGLGYMLGFTWEQIEEAYMAKNVVNHTRQDTGY